MESCEVMHGRKGLYLGNIFMDQERSEIIYFKTTYLTIKKDPQNQAGERDLKSGETRTYSIFQNLGVYPC